MIPNVGKYMITECPEDLDGRIPIKTVVCKSIENIMVHRKMTGFQLVSIMLYNSADPNDSLLDIALKYSPGWTISYVDPDILYDTSGTEIRRGFKIDNTTLYNFLISKVELAFNCVFTFDIINKTISAYSIPNLNDNVGVYFSFNNISSKLNLTEFSDEMTTALYCYGDGDLNIRGVNPLGTDVIYNFDYFTTSEWMSSDLVSAVNAWESKISGFQPTYAAYNSQLTNYYLEMYTLKTQLSELEAELAGLITELGATRAAGGDTTEVEEKIKNTSVAISSKNKEVYTKQLSIESVQQETKRITSQLQFTSKKNFERFLIELSSPKQFGSESSIYNIIVSFSKTWENIYNDISTAPELDLEQLGDSRGNIIEKFSSLISSLDYLILLMKSYLEIYWTLSEEQYSLLDSVINNSTKYLRDLFYLFDALIPNTSITLSIQSIINKFSIASEILNYSTNFTESQYLKLQDFIFENTYTNNFIVVDESKPPEHRQAQLQSLYDYGVSVLYRASKPRYELDGDFVNFLAMPEYQDFITKIELGKLVNIEVSEDETVESALLEIEYKYDDPTSFNMIFSNRVRLNNSNFQFADMFMKSAENASSVSGL
ncbi:MAG: hypothetical protein WA061_02400 [Microgenomates group bacterium]